jgi:hypothetical protein
VRPSPPLLRHAAHCYNHSNTIEHAGTGRRHTCHCSSYGPLSMAPSSPLEATPVNHYASTLEATPVRAQDAPRRRDWNQIRQDGHQLYGTVRHTATHIEIVQRACKLLPPWPIKGGAAPSCRGQSRDVGQHHSLALRLPTILALASIKPLGLGGHTYSPTSLVVTPLRAPRCKQYSAPSTPLVDVRPRPEPR